MNQNLRNALRRNVQVLRETLTDAFARQLEGTGGVLPDGTIQPTEAVPPLRGDPELRRRHDEIVAALRHERERLDGKDTAHRAVGTFALEAAFTWLNRLAALKLLEVDAEIMEHVDPVFYADPVTAARKGLGLA